MKKSLIFLVVFGMIMTICGCGKRETEETPAITDTSAPTETTPSTEPEETTEATEATEPVDNTEILTAYQMVLQEFYLEQMLPGAEKVDYEDFFGPITENRFAICDLNGDGMDELLLEYTTTSMAGMMGAVFGYDLATGEVTWEFRGFPSITFYDNGLAKVEASRNHSSSMTVWPYSLYKYSDGEYRLIASVSAWEREIQSEGYPADVDAENAGYVYNLMRDDVNEVVSKTDYEAWERETFSGEEMVIYYHYLTQESIDAITGAVG